MPSRRGSFGPRTKPSLENALTRPSFSGSLLSHDTQPIARHRRLPARPIRVRGTFCPHAPRFHHPGSANRPRAQPSAPRAERKGRTAHDRKEKEDQAEAREDHEYREQDHRSQEQNPRPYRESRILDKGVSQSEALRPYMLLLDHRARPKRERRPSRRHALMRTPPCEYRVWEGKKKNFLKIFDFTKSFFSRRAASSAKQAIESFSLRCFEELFHKI